LVEHIRETIRCDGPVTFAWFMEQALYHPQHGYYSSGRCTIGRHGDYFTSVSVGPLFGRLLAAQFMEMWEALGRSDDFSLVEQGAHGGELACDVLSAAKAHHSDFYRALRYLVVEPFPILEDRQRAALARHREKVTWRKSLAHLEPFQGVHFSNELIDAMPVNVVKWTGCEWVERQVAESNGRFGFLDLPPSDDIVAGRLRDLPSPLPSDYQTELNLAVPTWIDSLAGKLSRGFVVAIDYGFPRDEYYAPQRTAGTLRAYANHHVVPSPLTHVGHADITSHVEWTSLVESAEASGLAVSGFADQHHFITGLLTGPLGQEFTSSNDAKTKRALQTLLHPGFLGMKFQFLVLAKNVGASPSLSGLRFARDFSVMADRRI